MLVPNTLSISHLSGSEPEFIKDSLIHHVHFVQSSLLIREARLKQFQLETKSNPILQTLITCTTHEWPDKHLIPTDYYTFIYYIWLIVATLIFDCSWFLVWKLDSSENIEPISENIQNTDALRLSANENELNRNKNVLASQSTRNKRPSVVINKYPERQTEFSQPPVVTGTKLFCEAFLPSKGQRGILIFTDSIPKRIRIRELNTFMKNSKTKMVSFPGATSK